MLLTAKDLINKIQCAQTQFKCNNRAQFKILWVYPPNIDNEVYYHVLCLVCGAQFTVEQKEIK